MTSSAPDDQRLERAPTIRVDFQLFWYLGLDRCHHVYRPETIIVLVKLVVMILEIIRIRFNEIDHDGAADRAGSTSILGFRDGNDT